MSTVPATRHAAARPHLARRREHSERRREGMHGPHRLVLLILIIRLFVYGQIRKERDTFDKLLSSAVFVVICEIHLFFTLLDRKHDEDFFNIWLIVNCNKFQNYDHICSPKLCFFACRRQPHENMRCSDEYISWCCSDEYISWY